MNGKNIILALIIVTILAIIAYVARMPQTTRMFYNPGGYTQTMNTTSSYSATTIRSFEDCKRAGYQIMESYPEQCRTPGGQMFVNAITTTPTTIVYPPVQGGSTIGTCYVGGCSAQLCTDAPSAMSTCEYNPQYACYQQTSQCTRQSNGQCGWTQNAALSSCLNNAQ